MALPIEEQHRLINEYLAEWDGVAAICGSRPTLIRILRDRGWTDDDFLSSIHYALVMCAKKYNPNHKCKRKEPMRFSSYAYRMILWELSREASLALKISAREKRPKPDEPFDAEDKSEQPMSFEDKEHAEALIAKIKPRKIRDWVVMRFYGGLTYKQIAKQYGMTTQNVHIAVNRAVQGLR